MKKTMVNAILCGVLFALILSCTPSSGGGSSKSAAIGPEVPGTVWEWEAVTDAENGGSSTNTLTEVDGTYNFAGSITNQYQYGFTCMKAIPADEATLAALKTASAFSFTVKGDGARYAAKMPTTNIKDYCFYETVFETKAGEEVTVTIPVKTLVQPSWGSWAKFDQATAGWIEFQTTNNGKPGDFNITFSNLKIYQ